MKVGIKVHLGMRCSIHVAHADCVFLVDLINEAVEVSFVIFDDSFSISIHNCMFLRVKKFVKSPLLLFLLVFVAACPQYSSV